MRVTKKMLEDQLETSKKKHDHFKATLEGQLDMCRRNEEEAKANMYMNKGGINLLDFILEQLDAPLPEDEGNTDPE